MSNATFAGRSRDVDEIDKAMKFDNATCRWTILGETSDVRRTDERKRIIAVLEPRSNTMRMGVHRDTLGPSLAAADEVWLYAPPDLGWDVAAAVASLGAHAHLAQSIDRLVEALPPRLEVGDQVLIMSNGGFGGLHDRLLAALRSAPQAANAEGR